MMLVVEPVVPVMGAQSSDLLDVERIREDFPILQREFGGEQLVYLDNAATSQTPEPVVETIADYYRHTNANVHRGLHQLSQEASIAYEEAHDRVAEFVGAEGREEIVFTKNTTESMNLVAYAWGLNELGPGDEVVLTEMEHHAALVTWQQIAKKTGAEVKYIRVDDEGYLDMDHARELVGPDTAMVSVVHISNTLGTVNPVSELADLAHDHDAYIFVDGAQSVPNRHVDVEAIDADFLAFSGHKMAGPTGIGVLYGKRHILEGMEPYLYGGEMILKVDFEDSTWNELPWKYEAGTPVICQGIALAAACDYLDDIGMERIERHEAELAAYAGKRLHDALETAGTVPSVTVVGLDAEGLDGLVGPDGLPWVDGDSHNPAHAERLFRATQQVGEGEGGAAENSPTAVITDGRGSQTGPTGTVGRTGAPDTEADVGADTPPNPDEELTSRLLARLPPNAQVVVCTPLVDGWPVAFCRALAVRGYPQVVLSPDVTGSRTVGQRVGGLRRDLRLRTLERTGATVAGWHLGQPVDHALRRSLAHLLR